MPDHASPISPSPEDRFADALDALTLGVSLPDSRDMSLVTTARLVDALDASIVPVGSGPPALDHAAKRRIWADLMREHGGSTAASPVPQSPGAAGSTLAPNPWTSRPAPKPKRLRPSTGVLRFIPAAQPTSTFLLVIAVLALVGGTFATLSPGGDNGVFSTAMATEHPAQLAAASPEASPVGTLDSAQPITAEECTVAARPAADVAAILTSSTQRFDPEYLPVTRIDPGIAESVSLAGREWRSCATLGETREGHAMESAFYIASSPYGRLGDPNVWEDYRASVPIIRQLSDTVIHPDWDTYFIQSSNFDPFVLEEDETYRVVQDEHTYVPGQAFGMPGGRVGIPRSTLLAPNVQQSVPARGFMVIVVDIFVQDPDQENRWVLDESLPLCSGECEAFWDDPVPYITDPSRGWPAPIRSEASPVADACLVDSPAETSGDPLPDRLYRSGYGVPELNEIYVANRWQQIVACGPFDGLSGEIPRSMMTDRLAAEVTTFPATAWIVTEDEATAILSSHLAWHELEEMEHIYNEALEANPGFTGDPLALDAEIGVHRELADGRVALYSGTYWLAEDGRIEQASDSGAGTKVTIHIFAQEDRQWLYDETLLLCIGTCVGFETSGVPKPQLTIATSDAVNRQWLTPLTDESCVVATPDLAAASPTAPAIETDPADYLPFATADEADRVAAATTYLRFTSGCEATGDAPLKTNRGDVILGSPERPGTTQSQIDTSRAISEVLGYTDPIEILIANDAAVEITDDDGFTYIQKYFVLLPEDVVRLPDGRLGGMLRIQQVSNLPGAWTLELPTTTLFVTFDEVDGQWAITESFVVCIGECDDFWSESGTTEHTVATATPAHPATPRVDVAHARGGLDVATATSTPAS